MSYVLMFKNHEEQDAVMALYMEWGYKARERGENIQKAQADFQNAQ